MKKARSVKENRIMYASLNYSYFIQVDHFTDVSFSVKPRIVMKSNTMTAANRVTTNTSGGSVGRRSTISYDTAAKSSSTEKTNVVSGNNISEPQAGKYVEKTEFNRLNL